MIRCENLVKIFRGGESETVALQGLDLRVAKGELIAVMGASGSGKSTLLNVIGCMIPPDAGRVMLDGTDVTKLSAAERDAFRRTHIGFVWQNTARNLIPYLTAEQNVLAPMRLTSRPDRDRARELLATVGLSHKAQSTLMTLSGGEQQRVAIAVGLANDPPILLADEPTGSVDTETCDGIMELFRRVNRELGKTVVIVTHDRHLSGMVDRVIAIRDGRVSGELHRVREGGTVDRTHEEYAVIDKNGFVQIPKAVLEKAKIGNQVIFSTEKEGEIRIKRRDAAPEKGKKS